MCYIKNSQLDDYGNITKVVVWSTKNNTWAGVSTANRSRESGINNGTFQIVEEGDIVLLSFFPYESKSPITIAREVVATRENTDAMLCNIDTVPPGHDMNVGGVFQAVTNNLWLWLSNLDNVADGFLPGGIGWDGSFTLYDQRKRDRIRALLYGVTDEMLAATILEAGQISSGSETPTSWSEATGLPHAEPCVLEWEVNANTSKMVYAICWFKDNLVKTTKITEGLTKNIPFTVDPAATKVLIGTINAGGDKTKHLTRWKLYTR